MRSALLFPGQGAPASDWREAVMGWCPDLLVHARHLLDGEDPFERFGEGTEFDQPAIYCATVAAFEISGRPVADFHAGHSMGEISALVCAGAVGDHDGLRLVVQRGRLMAEAAEADGAGAMVAVRGSAEQVIDAVELGSVSIANLNSPSQTVLSGPADAIGAIAADLDARGVKAKRLPVAGAFHSPAMAPAASSFGDFLTGFEFAEPEVPVLSGRNARPFSDPRAELPASLLEPVRWIDVVAALAAEGVGTFREIGPGKALSGLVRKALPGVETEASRRPEAIGA